MPLALLFWYMRNEIVALYTKPEGVSLQKAVTISQGIENYLRS
jgi:hypothetical protein